MKLSVNLVVHNGERYIPFLFDALKRQTFNDWEMIIIDNASDDNTAAVFERELAGSGIKHRLLRNPENFGFAVGHNQAFRVSETPYVLMLNVDMYLSPDVLEKSVAFLDSHEQTAAVTPRLMRWDFERTLAARDAGSEIIEAAKAGFTSRVDAIGIRLFRNRRAIEWLAQQEWTADNPNPEVVKIFNKPAWEIFGVSGALPMYRKNMLEKILLPGENVFDPTYHSYKEDLDLAYRLRNAGYISCVLLDTVAYHDRTAAAPKETGDWAAIKNKKRQSRFVRFHSYKNHIRTLWKNEYWQNFLLDFPWIFWLELKKFIFILCTSPSIIFSGWWEIFKQRKYTRAAARTIRQTRRMYWRGIRRWFIF